MTTPTDDIAAWARDTLTTMATNIMAVGSTISSWLVVGNAGALVLILGAILNGTTCNQALLAAANQRFALGLAFSFVAALCGYALSIAAFSILSGVASAMNDIAINEFHIRELERDGVVLPDDNLFQKVIDATPHKMAVLNSRMRWVFAGLAVASALNVAGAIAFALGVLIPASAPAAMFESCSANAAGTAAVKLAVKLPTSK